MTRILLQGATVITISGQAVPDVADILVTDDRIAAIGSDLQAGDAEVIDLTGRIVLPGFVNAHMHTWQTALRGISIDWNLLQYLQHVHGRLAPRFSPEDMHIGTLAGALNQINCGTTTLGDWCHNNRTPEHTDAAIDALKASGIRSVFFHGTPPAEAGSATGPVAQSRAEIQRLLNSGSSQGKGALSIGLAIPGPLYSPTEVALADIRLAMDLGLVASFHHSGGPPADQVWVALEKADLLGPHLNVVHANTIEDALLSRLLRYGVSFTVTPEVEMSDAHGHPITGRLRAMGEAPSIGIDIETAISGDMMTAARIALAHQRALDNATARQTLPPGELPSPLPAREALAWATIHGARALGLSDEVGSLEPGKQADLIVIDTRSINLWPMHDPIATALHATPADIEAVMIAGSWQKRDGRLLCNAVHTLQSELSASAERVLASSE